MNDLDYLRLSKPQKLVHKLKEFIVNLPRRLFQAIKNLLLWIVSMFKKLGQGIGDLVTTYIHGDWKTKVSYTVMGFGSIARGQWMRGILFFAFQTVFNWYMYAMGIGFVKKLMSLGTVETIQVNRKTVYGDNSFLILLYGVLTIFFILAFLFTWYINIKQNKMSEKLLKAGKKLKTAKDDVKSMLDGQFHKTLLALPTLGVTIFTILPIIFMILVAFTNYDNQHRPPGKLFSWVGTENFQTLLSNPDTPVTLTVTSKGDTAAFQLNASNGDILTFSTLDVDAAVLAESITTQPTAKLSLAKEETEYTGTFVDEDHQFRLVATKLDPIEFKTNAILYSDPGIHLYTFLDDSLTVQVQESDDRLTLILANKAGQYVVLQTNQVEYAERIHNRVTGKSIKLTLTDSLHANFSLEETPGHITHQLIVSMDGVTRKVSAYGYSASSASLKMEDLMKQNTTFTMEKDAQGADVIKITGENGDYIALHPADTAAAQAVVELATPAAPAAMPSQLDQLAEQAQKANEPKLSAKLLTFNKHRLTMDVNGATSRIDGYELTASSKDVSVESMSSKPGAKLTVTVEDVDGVALLTVTSDSGEFVTLKTNNASKAQSIADASATDDPATVVKFTAINLSPYFDLVVFSDKGADIAFTANDMISVQTPSFSSTFKQVLFWTLIWSFFATFLNYFLGMMVAIMINKKGIKFKKLWRTILVMTIAIPQFISLLYVSKMFAADGLINGMLQNLGLIKEPLPFWTDPSWARVTIIGINIWIGIPYLMLIATGILMNIPADLYESARIDGANAFQTYRKITLPYMLFVTGPYLLTSFTGNINNFNVIFLLSQGKPLSLDLAGNAGSTDLLITWLYKMTVNDGNYKLAAVIGILVFIVCAVINLIVYNLIPSVKNEEDFQ